MFLVNICWLLLRHNLEGYSYEVFVSTNYTNLYQFMAIKSLRFCQIWTKQIELDALFCFLQRALMGKKSFDLSGFNLSFKVSCLSTKSSSTILSSYFTSILRSVSSQAYIFVGLWVQRV